MDQSKLKRSFTVLQDNSLEPAGYVPPRIVVGRGPVVESGGTEGVREQDDTTGHLQRCATLNKRDGYIENGGCSSRSSSSGEDSVDYDDPYPLPYPKWGEETTLLDFESVEEYERMVKEIEAIVQMQLVEHPYNTVGSFLKFYDAYRQHSWLSLDEFFRLYDPPITPEHHTCVGLSLDLVDRIKKSSLQLTQPRLLSAIFLASCEEEYGPDVSTYMADGVPEAEEALKEHVVVALRVRIAGRYGAMVLDTGYHIARAVTAMEDCARPHTGWFVQSQTAKATKRYNYSLSKNRQYVLWEVVEQRGGQVKVQPTSLIYIQQRFVNAVDVVERRNLVYDFKVWMVRDSAGSLLAGFFFPLRANGAFTLYLNGLGEREECKIPLSYFTNVSNMINNNFELAIARCNAFMQRWCGQGGLREVLVKIACIVDNEPFLCSAIDLNRLIEET